MKLSYIIIIVVLAALPYVYNATKFVGCDFVADYRCEVIHGIGVVIPPASYVTVWFDSD